MAWADHTRMPGNLSENVELVLVRCRRVESLRGGVAFQMYFAVVAMTNFQHYDRRGGRSLRDTSTFIVFNKMSDGSGSGEPSKGGGGGGTAIQGLGKVRIWMNIIMIPIFVVILLVFDYVVAHTKICSKGQSEEENSCLTAPDQKTWEIVIMLMIIGMCIWWVVSILFRKNTLFQTYSGFQEGASMIGTAVGRY